MRKLSNYSIETDHLIWLEFNDGQHLRVEPGQVSDYLAGSDLAKVKRALKLRRDFIRQNFPKTLVLLAALGMGAFAIADSKEISNFISNSHAITKQSSPTVNPAVALPTATSTAAPTLTPATPPPAPVTVQTVNPGSEPNSPVPAASNAIAPVLQSAPAPASDPLIKVLNNLTSKIIK